MLVIYNRLRENAPTRRERHAVHAFDMDHSTGKGRQNSQKVTPTRQKRRQNGRKVTPTRQKRRQNGRKVTPCTRRVVPKEMPAQRGYPTVWDHFPLTC